MFKLTALIFSLCFMFTVVFSNPMIAEAAAKVLLNFGEAALSADEVSADLYLTNVITLNDNASYVGTFSSQSDYAFYYGTSKDMINWELKSKYFSLVHGNGVFAGLSGEYDNHKLSYTKDGVTWQETELPEGLNPISVKFENGYFKLYCKDNNDNVNLLLSRDAENWFDVTNDLPGGTHATRVIIKDNNIYTLTGTDIEGDGFRVYTASSIDENQTAWNPVESLKKDGYGMLPTFMFDGKTVGVQLYSIAEYEKENIVGDKLYFVTNDFVNWTEKDWTQGNYSYYDIYTYSSTEKKNTQVDGKRFEAVENYPYFDGDTMYYVSYVVFSEDGTNWKKEKINVFLNGTKLSKEPAEKNAINIPESYEWARKGVEYALSRDYAYLWDLEYTLPQNISRGEYLNLIMRALNVKAPETPVEGFEPFSDSYFTDDLVNRAKMLGLVKGKENNVFDYDDFITRQDVMVMTYNILFKLGKIEEDASLSAIQDYVDKDQVSDYAKVAVSSLIKSGLIKGDGVNINPLSNMTYAEALTLAEKMNVYRDR